MGERGLLCIYLMVFKFVIEFCNGIGVGLGDFRFFFGVVFVEYLKDERLGRKRG